MELLHKSPSKLGSVLPAFLVAALLGVAIVTSGVYLKAGTATVGYGLVGVLCLAFLRYPRMTLMASLGLKPVIDMFWWTKAQGLLSPLFVAGVAIPVLALLGLPRIAAGRRRLAEDRLVMAYLGSFLVLSLCKIAVSPEFWAESLENYLRILSVTSFYFIGKYYFPTAELRRRLALVLAGSSITPFALTAAQQALGWNITTWREVIDQAAGPVDTSHVSAFYMSARHGLNRISGVYEGVYTLAFLGVFTMLILLVLRVSRDVRFHPAGYLLFGFAAYFAYFTYSRSAWVVLALGAALFFVVRRQLKMVAALLAGALGLWASVETVRFRFEDELGFVLGTHEFSNFGYGRGRLWGQAWDVFSARDPIYQLVGTYGQGNPENQFLNVLFWFGYLGLAVFVAFLVLMTIRLVGWLKKARLDGRLDTNLRIQFAVLVVVCYWFAGLGNNFFLQISTQWILWLWTGIVLAVAAEERAEARAARYHGGEVAGHIRPLRLRDSGR